MKRGAWWGTVPGVTKEADMTQQLNNNNNNNITHIFNVFIWVCINIFMYVIYITYNFICVNVQIRKFNICEFAHKCKIYANI